MYHWQRSMTAGHAEDFHQRARGPEHLKRNAVLETHGSKSIGSGPLRAVALVVGCITLQEPLTQRTLGCHSTLSAKSGDCLHNL